MESEKSRAEMSESERNDEFSTALSKICYLTRTSMPSQSVENLECLRSQLMRLQKETTEQLHLAKLAKNKGLSPAPEPEEEPVFETSDEQEA